MNFRNVNPADVSADADDTPTQHSMDLQKKLVHVSKGLGGGTVGGNAENLHRVLNKPRKENFMETKLGRARDSVEAHPYVEKHIPVLVSMQFRSIVERVLGLYFGFFSHFQEHPESPLKSLRKVGGVFVESSPEVGANGNTENSSISSSSSFLNSTSMFGFLVAGREQSSRTKDGGSDGTGFRVSGKKSARVQAIEGDEDVKTGDDHHASKTANDNLRVNIDADTANRKPTSSVSLDIKVLQPYSPKRKLHEETGQRPTSPTSPKNGIDAAMFGVSSLSVGKAGSYRLGGGASADGNGCVSGSKDLKPLDIRHQLAEGLFDRAAASSGEERRSKERQGKEFANSLSETEKQKAGTKERMQKSGSEAERSDAERKVKLKEEPQSIQFESPDGKQSPNAKGKRPINPYLRRGGRKGNANAGNDPLQDVLGGGEEFIKPEELETFVSGTIANNLQGKPKLVLVDGSPTRGDLDENSKVNDKDHDVSTSSTGNMDNSNRADNRIQPQYMRIQGDLSPSKPRHVDQSRKSDESPEQGAEGPADSGKKKRKQQKNRKDRDGDNGANLDSQKQLTVFDNAAANPLGQFSNPALYEKLALLKKVDCKISVTYGIVQRKQDSEVTFLKDQRRELGLNDPADPAKLAQGTNSLAIIHANNIKNHEMMKANSQGPQGAGGANNANNANGNNSSNPGTASGSSADKSSATSTGPNSSVVALSSTVGFRHDKNTVAMKFDETLKSFLKRLGEVLKTAYIRLHVLDRSKMPNFGVNALASNLEGGKKSSSGGKKSSAAATHKAIANIANADADAGKSDGNSPPPRDHHEMMFAGLSAEATELNYGTTKQGREVKSLNDDNLSKKNPYLGDARQQGRGANFTGHGGSPSSGKGNRGGGDNSDLAGIENGNGNGNSNGTDNINAHMSENLNSNGNSNGSNHNNNNDPVSQSYMEKYMRTSRDPNYVLKKFRKKLIAFEQLHLDRWKEQVFDYYLPPNLVAIQDNASKACVSAIMGVEDRRGGSSNALAITDGKNVTDADKSSKNPDIDHHPLAHLPQTAQLSTIMTTVCHRHFINIYQINQEIMFEKVYEVLHSPILNPDTFFKVYSSLSFAVNPILARVLVKTVEGRKQMNRERWREVVQEIEEWRQTNSITDGNMNDGSNMNAQRSMRGGGGLNATVGPQGSKRKGKSMNRQGTTTMGKQNTSKKTMSRQQTMQRQGTIQQGGAVGGQKSNSPKPQNLGLTRQHTMGHASFHHHGHAAGAHHTITHVNTAQVQDGDEPEEKDLLILERVVNTENQVEKLYAGLSTEAAKYRISSGNAGNSLADTANILGADTSPNMNTNTQQNPQNPTNTIFPDESSIEFLACKDILAEVSGFPQTDSKFYLPNGKIKANADQAEHDSNVNQLTKLNFNLNSGMATYYYKPTFMHMSKHLDQDEEENTRNPMSKSDLHASRQSRREPIPTDPMSLLNQKSPTSIFQYLYFDICGYKNEFALNSKCDELCTSLKPMQMGIKLLSTIERKLIRNRISLIRCQFFQLDSQELEVILLNLVRERTSELVQKAISENHAKTEFVARQFELCEQLLSRKPESEGELCSLVETIIGFKKSVKTADMLYPMGESEESILENNAATAGTVGGGPHVQHSPSQFDHHDDDDFGNFDEFLNPLYANETPADMGMRLDASAAISDSSSIVNVLKTACRSESVEYTSRLKTMRKGLMSNQNLNGGNVEGGAAGAAAGHDGQSQAQRASNQPENHVLHGTFADLFGDYGSLASEFNSEQTPSIYLMLRRVFANVLEWQRYFLHSEYIGAATGSFDLGTAVADGKPKEEKKEDSAENLKDADNRRKEFDRKNDICWRLVEGDEEPEDENVDESNANTNSNSSTTALVTNPSNSKTSTTSNSSKTSNSKSETNNDHEEKIKNLDKHSLKKRMKTLYSSKRKKPPKPLPFTKGGILKNEEEAFLMSEKDARKLRIDGEDVDGGDDNTSPVSSPRSRSASPHRRLKSPRNGSSTSPNRNANKKSSSTSSENKDSTNKSLRSVPFGPDSIKNRYYRNLHYKAGEAVGFLSKQDFVGVYNAARAFSGFGSFLKKTEKGLRELRTAFQGLIEEDFEAIRTQYSQLKEDTQALLSREDVKGVDVTVGECEKLVATAKSVRKEIRELKRRQVRLVRCAVVTVAAKKGGRGNVGNAPVGNFGANTQVGAQDHPDGPGSDDENQFDPTASAGLGSPAAGIGSAVGNSKTEKRTLMPEEEVLQKIIDFEKTLIALHVLVHILFDFWKLAFDLNTKLGLNHWQKGSYFTTSLLGIDPIALDADFARFKKRYFRLEEALMTFGMPKRIELDPLGASEEEGYTIVGKRKKMQRGAANTDNADTEADASSSFPIKEIGDPTGKLEDRLNRGDFLPTVVVDPSNLGLYLSESEMEVGFEAQQLEVAKDEMVHVEKVCAEYADGDEIKSSENVLGGTNYINIESSGNESGESGGGVQGNSAGDVDMNKSEERMVSKNPVADTSSAPFSALQTATDTTNVTVAADNSASPITKSPSTYKKRRQRRNTSWFLRYGRTYFFRKTHLGEIFQQLFKSIHAFETAELTLLRCLLSPFLRDSHWQEISDVAGFGNFQESQPTLARMKDMGLFQMTEEDRRNSLFEENIFTNWFMASNGNGDGGGNGNDGKNTNDSHSGGGYSPSGSPGQYSNVSPSAGGGNENHGIGRQSSGSTNNFMDSTSDVGYAGSGVGGYAGSGVGGYAGSGVGGQSNYAPSGIPPSGTYAPSATTYAHSSFPVGGGNAGGNGNPMRPLRSPRQRDLSSRAKLQSICDKAWLEAKVREYLLRLKAYKVCGGLRKGGNDPSQNFEILADSAEEGDLTLDVGKKSAKLDPHFYNMFPLYPSYYESIEYHYTLNKPPHLKKKKLPKHLERQYYTPFIHEDTCSRRQMLKFFDLERGIRCLKRQQKAMESVLVFAIQELATGDEENVVQFGPPGAGMGGQSPGHGGSPGGYNSPAHSPAGSSPGGAGMTMSPSAVSAASPSAVGKMDSENTRSRASVQSKSQYSASKNSASKNSGGSRTEHTGHHGANGSPQHGHPGHPHHQANPHHLQASAQRSVDGQETSGGATFAGLHTNGGYGATTYNSGADGSVADGGQGIHGYGHGEGGAGGIGAYSGGVNYNDNHQTMPVGDKLRCVYAMLLGGVVKTADKLSEQLSNSGSGAQLLGNVNHENTNPNANFFGANNLNYSKTTSDTTPDLSPEDSGLLLDTSRYLGVKKEHDLNTRSMVEILLSGNKTYDDNQDEHVRAVLKLFENREVNVGDRLFYLSLGTKGTALGAVAKYMNQFYSVGGKSNSSDGARKEYVEEGEDGIEGNLSGSNSGSNSGAPSGSESSKGKVGGEKKKRNGPPKILLKDVLTNTYYRRLEDSVAHSVVCEFQSGDENSNELGNPNINLNRSRSVRPQTLGGKLGNANTSVTSAIPSSSKTSGSAGSQAPGHPPLSLNLQSSGSGSQLSPTSTTMNGATTINGGITTVSVIMAEGSTPAGHYGPNGNYNRNATNNNTNTLQVAGMNLSLPAGVSGTTASVIAAKQLKQRQQFALNVLIVEKLRLFSSMEMWTMLGGSGESGSRPESRATSPTGGNSISQGAVAGSNVSNPENTTPGGSSANNSGNTNANNTNTGAGKSNSSSASNNGIIAGSNASAGGGNSSTGSRSGNTKGSGDSRNTTSADNANQTHNSSRDTVSFNDPNASNSLAIFKRVETLSENFATKQRCLKEWMMLISIWNMMFPLLSVKMHTQPLYQANCKSWALGVKAKLLQKGKDNSAETQEEREELWKEFVEVVKQKKDEGIASGGGVVKDLSSAGGLLRDVSTSNDESKTSRLKDSGVVTVTVGSASESGVEKDRVEILGNNEMGGGNVNNGSAELEDNNIDDNFVKPAEEVICEVLRKAEKCNKRLRLSPPAGSGKRVSSGSAGGNTGNRSAKSTIDNSATEGKVNRKQWRENIRRLVFGETPGQTRKPRKPRKKAADSEGVSVTSGTETLRTNESITGGRSQEQVVHDMPTMFQKFNTLEHDIKKTLESSNSLSSPFAQRLLHDGLQRYKALPGFKGPTSPLSPPGSPRNSTSSQNSPRTPRQRPKTPPSPEHAEARNSLADLYESSKQIRAAERKALEKQLFEPVIHPNLCSVYAKAMVKAEIAKRQAGLLVGRVTGTATHEEVEEKVEEKLAEEKVDDPLDSSPEDGTEVEQQPAGGASESDPESTPNHLTLANEREEKHEKFNRKHDKFARKFQSLESDLKRLLETMFLHPDVTGHPRETMEAAGVEANEDGGAQSGDDIANKTNTGVKSDSSMKEQWEHGEGMFLDHLIPYLGEVRQLRRTFAKLESRYLKFIVAEKVE